MSAVQRFLVCNVFYFVKHALASVMVSPKRAQNGMDLDHFRVRCDPTAETQAKSLIISMVPASALAHVAIRRYFVEYLVFSFHFHSFSLVFPCLATNAHSPTLVAGSA